jgi:hypothetical protein
MSCCGQRRRTLSSATPLAASAPATPPAARATSPARGQPSGAVTVRYRGLGPFTMRSARTGRLYACGGTGATLQVDAEDVDALVRSRLFTRA